MIVALRTDLKVCFQILLPERVFASAAFNPQAFRNDTAFIRGLHRFFLALEPCHKRFLTIQELRLRQMNVIMFPVVTILLAKG